MTDINASFRRRNAERDWRSVHIAADNRASVGMYKPRSPGLLAWIVGRAS